MYPKASASPRRQRSRLLEGGIKNGAQGEKDVAAPRRIRKRNVGLERFRSVRKKPIVREADACLRRHLQQANRRSANRTATNCRFGCAGGWLLTQSGFVKLQSTINTCYSPHSPNFVQRDTMISDRPTERSLMYSCRAVNETNPRTSSL